MTTIHAPAADYSGTSQFGPVALTFTDGVASYDGDLPDGLRAYLAGAGYGIGSKKATVLELPEPPDPRDHQPELVGTELRDAAVDPHPEDFLPPTKAGEANPHGPQVVAPGIHAVETLAVVPGAVGAWGTDDDGNPIVVKDTDAQAAKETAFAQAVLTDDNVPVPDATADAVAEEPEADHPNVVADEQFDPSAHNIPEVKEYLDKADDAEYERVLEAERHGKARTGVLG